MLTVSLIKRKPNQFLAFNAIVNKNRIFRLDVGFDQIGALFGRVIIDNDRNEKETFELNFPGLRKVRLNQSTIENKRNESIEIMAVGADGSVLTLTQNRLNDQPNK